MNGSGVDVADLRAFLAVADELHFGRAADLLGVAQPALSRTIKELEARIGARLFDRSTRSVALTHAGSSLVAPARDVLTALDRAESVVRAAQRGERGEVRVAFASTSAHPVVASLARAVRAHHPEISLQLTSQVFSQPAMRQLVARDIDLALGRWDRLPDGVEARVIRADRLELAVPDTHRLAALAAADFSSLAGESFVSLPPLDGAVLTDRLQQLGIVHGFVPEIVQVAPDTQTALALVGAEVGCHLTLGSVADSSTDAHVVFLPVAEAPWGTSRDVHMRVAWRRDDASAATLMVLDQLLAVAAEGFA